MKVEAGLPIGLSGVAAAAREAEELGYDGVLSFEAGHDPFLPLALAAASTERVSLGSAVAIAFPRSPMTVAQMAWDIQALSRGRLLLGLGTQVKGHNERRYSTPWTGPAGPRLREYILVLRAIWDSWQNKTPANFRGKHYTYTLMTPFFDPGPIDHPDIAVYISAVNPYMCRLAGELCDGVRLHGFCTPKYLKEVVLPNIEAGAKKAGRSLKDVDITGGGFVITGETEEDIARQKQAVRTQVAFYGSTRTYKGVLDIHGWGDTCLKLHRLAAEGRWLEMGREITDEMLEQFAIMATYDQVAARIKERWGGIVGRTGFFMPIRHQGDRERLKEIIRQIQAI
ncbi:MAG: TIGR03617 family F420-dependent LLM class oxidoreductase [Chloroflexota bacterium]|nr:TIGR03617 family F420-dependent LLM class oxidoreductase [Chloroflexota bacterium]